MFASAYMGRRRWAQPYDRFCHLTRNSAPKVDSQPSLRDSSSLKSLPRTASWAKFSSPYGTHFRPIYTEAYMGHPSKEESFVLCSDSDQATDCT